MSNISPQSYTQKRAAVMSTTLVFYCFRLPSQGEAHWTDVAATYRLSVLTHWFPRPGGTEIWNKKKLSKRKRGNMNRERNSKHSRRSKRRSHGSSSSQTLGIISYVCTPKQLSDETQRLSLPWLLWGTSKHTVQTERAVAPFTASRLSCSAIWVCAKISLPNTRKLNAEYVIYVVMCYSDTAE